MISSTDYSKERLEETVVECNELRERYKALLAKVGEAEHVIRYYSDPKSYAVSVTSCDTCYQDRIIGDTETADNTPKTRVAGLRARLYLKRYEDR